MYPTTSVMPLTTASITKPWQRYSNSSIIKPNLPEDLDPALLIPLAKPLQVIEYIGLVARAEKAFMTDVINADEWVWIREVSKEILEM